MKYRNTIIVGLVTATLGLAAVAQGPQGPRYYDAKTEVTVKGTIQDIQEQTGRRGRMGTHLVVKTDSSTLLVHVGPSAYIARKQFSFAKGEEIKVLGSKVTIAGTETLLAREITKDGKVLVLRNTQGIPEWAAGPRQQ